MKEYTTPEIEIVEFYLEDITTANVSFTDGSGIFENDPDDYWW